MIKEIFDNRYQRLIKQALNRRFGNKNAVNKHLAKIISDFSHSSIIEKGNFLLCRNLEFFVVKKKLSNHWIQGYFCPSELQFNNGLFYYIPKFWNRSVDKKKKVFRPFSRKPFVKVRRKNFYLQRNTRYESLSNLNDVLLDIS